MEPRKKRTTSTPEPTNVGPDLLPSPSTMITCRSDGHNRMLSLFEAASGDYFVVRSDENGESIIPVTPTIAGMILAEENRRHMAHIFQRKLQVAAIGKIDGRSFDTTKDELTSDFSDEVEAIATYRTTNGVEYMRLMSPWADTIVLFNKSDWNDVVESAEFWVGCGRSYVKHIDWPYPVEPASMTGVAVNEQTHDAKVWRYD